MVKKILLPAGSADPCGVSSAFTDLSTSEIAPLLASSLKPASGQLSPDRCWLSQNVLSLMMQFRSELCLLSGFPDYVHLPRFYLHHREVFDMGGCGLPKVPRKTLPLAWKYSKRLVPSDSILQDCSPCVPATTGLSSPGDQREAETLNVNTGSSPQSQIAGRKVGFAPLALHNLMQTLPWQKRSGEIFIFQRSQENVFWVAKS